jgi:hypothetical protein
MSVFTDLLKERQTVSKMSQGELAVAKAFFEAGQKNPPLPKGKKRPSRSDRFQHAVDLVSDARSEAEELKEELESWRENLPENLQDGNKACELDDAMSELDDFISDCETAEGHDVCFPSMFG